MKKLIFILFFVSMFVSCNRQTIYSEYRSLPLSGWSSDSALVFDVVVQDTIQSYDIIIDVRHTTNYPYQNMWLLVNNDTIDFYLANHRGEWLGNGGGELREMPVLYKQDYRFNSMDTISYTIVQGMRDKCLKGVRDVGLIIKKHE